MNGRYRFTLAFLLILTLAWPLPYAFSAPPINDEVAAADDRLPAQKVTLFASRIYIGALLAAWAKQTGVPLSASEKDGACDEQVTVFVKDLPLRDAMNGLWSLLSYRGATWTWERYGDKGNYAYVLHQSQAARDLPNQIPAQVQQDFEAHAAAVVEGVKLDDAGRKKIPEKKPFETTYLNDATIREGAAAFGSALTPDQQQKVLREHEPIQVKISDLGEEGQRFVDDAMDKERRLNPGQAIPAPKYLQFETVLSGLAPTLVVSLATDDGTEGRGILGGAPFHKKWFKSFRDRWILPWDTANLATQETRVATAPEPKRSEAEQTRKKETDERLRYQQGRQRIEERLTRQASRFRQIAEALGVPVMARLPRNVPGKLYLADPGAPYRMTLAAFLQRAEDCSLDHKWFKGILLVTSHRRLVDGTGTMSEPWRVVNLARQFKSESPDGTLTLAQMGAITAGLSEDQLTRVILNATDGTEFDSLRGALGPFHDLFRLIGQKPEIAAKLTRPSGVGIAEVQPALAKTTLLNGPQAPGSAPPAALRVRESERDIESQGAVKLFDFEVLAADGTVIQHIEAVGQVKRTKQ